MDIGTITIRLLLSVVLAAGVRAERPAPELKTAQAKLHYQKAREFGDKGLWAPAILELNQARQAEPRNADILVELGIAYGELHEWKRAIASLRSAVALAPSSVEAHYNLALTLDRADPGKGAGTLEYRKVLKLDPRHVNALINLGINAGDQDSAEARSLFERAIHIDPKNPRAHLNLGLLLKRESQETASISEFREAIRLDPDLLEARRQLAALLTTEQQWDAVIEQCREILKRQPDDASTRYTLGQALIRNQKAEEGAAELERAQAIRKRLQQQQEAQKLQSQGIREMNLGKHPEAIQAFTSAVNLDPSADNHMYLGMALAASGDVKSGIREITAAQEREPNSARVRLNLGSVYLQAGQEHLAKSEFDKALQLDPWFAEAHNNLGLILAKEDRIQEALDHFRLAADLNPEYPDALFNLGLALRGTNRLDDALKAFRRAAELAPKNARIQYALGLTLKDKGDAAGGQAALDRAAQLESRKQ